MSAQKAGPRKPPEWMISEWRTFCNAIEEHTPEAIDAVNLPAQAEYRKALEGKFEDRLDYISAALCHARDAMLEMEPDCAQRWLRRVAIHAWLAYLNLDEKISNWG